MRSLYDFQRKTQKLFKLIFMVRFIKILEQVWLIEEEATYRLVPMKAGKDAQKIIKDYHKVYNFLIFLNT